MPLKPIEGGLHRLRYDSKSVAKVQLAVQPGDELEVSADVASQLVAADPHFKPAGEPATASDAPQSVSSQGSDPGRYLGDDVEALKEQYRLAAGKVPDRRWKTAKRLRQALDELQTDP